MQLLRPPTQLCLSVDASLTTDDGYSEDGEELHLTDAAREVGLISFYGAGGILAGCTVPHVRTGYDEKIYNFSCATFSLHFL